MNSDHADEVYQDQILPRVSRSFALTIPQLPLDLRTPVTNAYLLCRIADTIEDESALSAGQTLLYLRQLLAVMRGKDSAARMARELLPQLRDDTLPAERELVCNMERVIRVTARLRERQRRAIDRCLETMCGGMHQFQRTASLRGLPRMQDLDDYCYYVAGVVGQLVTDLFCDYSAAIAQRRAELNALAVSFAQGLQMTNILKDMWEDRNRGACWLPQEIFARHGIDLVHLSAPHQTAEFAVALSELVGVAHAHLRNALTYTLLIPGDEVGIRRFCLWAIGLAILTLRNIERTPGFKGGKQVKVSHAGVAVTRMLTNFAIRNDGLLIRLFDAAARDLPLASLPSMHETPSSALGTKAAGGWN